MKTTPKILMGVKDFKGKYIEANEILLSEMGYKNKQQLLGRSEYDIGREVFSESLEGSDVLVDQFLLEDEKAFQGKEISGLCVHKWLGQLKFLVSYKQPFYDDRKKIIGAIGYSYEIINPHPSYLKSYLIQKKEKNFTISQQSQNHIDYYLNEFLKNIPLNSRELECVNLLAKGNTAKEIAQQLKLSNRTVEFYLDNARTKLKCANRYELIYKCNENGWL